MSTIKIPKETQPFWNLGGYTIPETKIQCLRDCGITNPVIETPEAVEKIWREVVPKHPAFNPDIESMIVFTVNTRRRCTGFYRVSEGTLDTLLVHCREVYRQAIIRAAAAIVLTHNHPSGDPTPSEGDIKCTRDFIRAGQLLKVEMLDHVIIGDPKAPKSYCSLRELGYFAGL